MYEKDKDALKGIMQDMKEMKKKKLKKKKGYMDEEPEVSISILAMDKKDK